MIEMTYLEKAEKLLDSQSGASEWLKSSILSNNAKDILDAVNDAQCLYELFLLKYKELKRV